MKPTLQLVSRMLGAISCLVLPACISGTIVGSGKRYEHLERTNATVEKVRHELGSPSYSQFYKEPISLNMTPEYKSFKRSTGSSPFIWGDDTIQESQPVSLCEVYTRIGPFAEMERGQGYAMAGFMRLGIADAVLLPIAIKERAALNKQRFSITFWYSEDKKVQGYYTGDVRYPASRW